MDYETRQKWKEALIFGGILVLLLSAIICVDSVLLESDKEGFCLGKEGIQYYPICERNDRYRYCEADVSVPIDCGKYG